MKINAGQLQGQLQRGLAGVYWVAGDETLLVQECCDALRRFCRDHGFGEREIHHVERGFDWQALVDRANSLSLFAEKQLLELRISSPKPANEVFEAITEYAGNANPDTVVLVTSPKLDSKLVRTKPYDQLEKAVVMVQVWPVGADQLPDWVRAQFRNAGLTIEPEALELLCQRVEGNLLAARQEIDRIALLVDGRAVSVPDIEHSVGDSARYTAFGLVDQALASDLAGALRTLRGLRAEGNTPSAVLWPLAREIQMLVQVRERASALGPDQALREARVWSSREQLVRRALRRLGLPQLYPLVALCRDTDLAIKGAGLLDPWDLLEDTVLALGGQPLPTSS